MAGLHARHTRYRPSFASPIQTRARHEGHEPAITTSTDRYLRHDTAVKGLGLGQLRSAGCGCGPLERAVRLQRNPRIRRQRHLRSMAGVQHHSAEHDDAVSAGSYPARIHAPVHSGQDDCVVRISAEPAVLREHGCRRIPQRSARTQRLDTARRALCAADGIHTDHEPAAGKPGGDVRAALRRKGPCGLSSRESASTASTTRSRI